MLRIYCEWVLMMRIWPVCQIRVFRIREFRMNFSAICTVFGFYYAPGDDSPHGGILLLLCPYVCMYVCPSLVKVFG